MEGRRQTCQAQDRPGPVGAGAAPCCPSCSPASLPGARRAHLLSTAGRSRWARLNVRHADCPSAVYGYDSDGALYPTAVGSLSWFALPASIVPIGHCSPPPDTGVGSSGSAAWGPRAVAGRPLIQQTHLRQH
jgi:hypothetical protein